MASQRGFTLLEMLITLGIAALLASVALPLLHRPPSSIDMDAVVREVAGSLREARAAAIAGNRAVSFSLDVNRKVFGHDQMRVLGNGGQVSTGDLRIVAYTAEDPSRSRAAAVIRFFPDGGSSGGQIEFRSGARRSLVDVDWLTGRISVTRNGAG